MKKNNKIKSIRNLFVTSIAALALLAGCGTSDSSVGASLNNPEQEQAALPDNEGEDKAEGEQGTPLKIGILQAVEHPALDASREGFTAALAEAGYVDGENIVINYQNGQGDLANLKTMSTKLISDKTDLVLAIATPAAQSIASETQTIPIVITAVTDPQEAKLVAKNEDTQTNVTGTSDMAPYKEQLDLLMKLLPDTKNLAIMYTSSEDNSVIQARLVEEYAVNTLGLTVEHKTISSSNDINQVAQSLVGKFDAVYAPTDNTIAAAMPTLANVAVNNNIPVICAEEGMVTNGGLASVSISYYDLGYKSGEMAVKILNGESTPQQMPIEYAPNPTLIFNQAMFDALGMEIPADLAEGAKIVNTAE